MNSSIRKMLNRLDEIERELFEMRLKLSSLSFDREGVEGAVKRFLALHEDVSRRWKGKPFVVEESRKSRRHNNYGLKRC